MEAADEDAEIIFGTVIDDSLGENVKVTVIATGLQIMRKEATGYAAAPAPAYSRPMASPVYVEQAPVREEAPLRTVETPRYEARNELPSAAPEMNTKTDYAVKSEMTFDFEHEEVKAAPVPEAKPKINWAEKLQSAASKYESQKSFDAPVRQTSAQSAYERPNEYHHVDPTPAQEVKNENLAQNRESRIKSIAEKLGFFNFDEDEFDTPSFMKKNERSHDSQI
jgi:cell division protein FtsZ